MTAQWIRATIVQTATARTMQQRPLSGLTAAAGSATWYCGSRSMTHLGGNNAGKVDKAARMQSRLLRSNGYDSTATADSEVSQSTDSSDANGVEGDEQPNSAVDDDSSPEAVGPLVTDAHVTVDVEQLSSAQRQQQQQQQEQQLGPRGSDSDALSQPRSSDSLSADSSDQLAVEGSTARVHQLGRNLPSMILKHISALKKENTEAGDSLSISTMRETQVGQHELLHGPSPGQDQRQLAQGSVRSSAIGGVGSSLEASAGSLEPSVGSRPPPTRHVRHSSRMDGLEHDRVVATGLHATKRSVTSMRTASGKWPSLDLMAGNASTPSLAHIGRSLLHKAHDDQAGDGGLDIDSHINSLTRGGGTHSGQRGDGPSRTGSASAAPSGAAVESTRSSLSPGQLKADLLASGLIRDRTHLFTVYPASVPASELIDWLIANHHADDREHACLVSKTLMLVGLRSFHQQSADTAAFEDDGRYYSFAGGETKGALRMAFERPRDRAVSTKQALASLVQRAAASAQKRSVSPTQSLAGQVDRLRAQSNAHSRLKQSSSAVHSDIGLQLGTLQEVTVDRQQHPHQQGGADSTTAAPSAAPVSRHSRVPSSLLTAAAAFGFGTQSPALVPSSQSNASSPPAATRPVFLRERKASRWQVALAAHADDQTTSVTNGQQQSQAQQHDEFIAAEHTNMTAGSQFPSAVNRADRGDGRSPASTHHRSSTTAVSPNQARAHRLVAAGGSGATATAAAKSTARHAADGLSATQDALFALGVADLALIESHLAEQKQRDEYNVKAAAKTAQQQVSNADNHTAFDRQTATSNKDGHARSPTLPAAGMINIARSDSPSHSKSKTLTFFSTPRGSPAAPLPSDAGPANRANSLRNMLHMSKKSIG